MRSRGGDAELVRDQLPGGHAGELGIEVPQRQFDGGDGMGAVAVAAGLLVPHHDAERLVGVDARCRSASRMSSGFAFRRRGMNRSRSSPLWA